MNKISFHRGIERVSTESFSTGQARINPTGHNIYIDGGRVPRYVDDYFDVPKQSGDLILEWVRPKVKNLDVTVPMVFARTFLRTKKKLEENKKHNRDVRRRQLSARALIVLEELGQNMQLLQDYSSSVRKA